jgi:hypothetical protein
VTATFSCVKRALKREAGYPVGVSAPLYLDCTCGHHLSILQVKGLPMTYQCACGIEYDAQGWIVGRPAIS